MQTFNLTLKTSWNSNKPTRKELFLYQYPTVKDRLELYKLSLETLVIILAFLAGIKQLINP